MKRFHPRILLVVREIPPAAVAGDEEIPAADTAGDNETGASNPIRCNHCRASHAITDTPSTAAVIEPAASEVIDLATTPDRAPAYIAIALRYARVLMVVTILAIFARLWEIDFRAISAQLLGQRFSECII